MKHLPLPSATPLLVPDKFANFGPIHWLHSLPFFSGIPSEVLWSVSSSFVTMVLIYIYNAVRLKQVLTVKVAIMEELTKNKMEIETFIQSRFDKWGTDHTNQMVQIGKIQTTLDHVVKVVDLHGGELRSLRNRETPRGRQ